MFAFLQTRQSLCLLGSRASFGQTSLAVQPLLASSNWQTHRSYVSHSLAAFAADNGEDDGDLLPPMPPSSFTAPQREEQTISAPIDVDDDDDDLPIPQEPVSAPDGQWSYDDLIIAKHSSMHPNVLAVKEIERSSQPSFEELSDSDSDSDDDVTGADDEASRIRSFDAMTGGVFSKRTIEGLGNRDIRLIHSEDADQIDDEPSLLDQTVSRFDDEGRREFKSRVKIGNLRKPGQIEEEDEPKTAEQIAAENPIVEAADFDSREEEMLKLTANRGHFAFARPELRRKSSSEAMNYEKDEGSDGDDDDDDDDDDEQLLEELADSDVEPDSQPILYGNTDLLEEQRYREEREAWEVARTSAQKLDDMVFSVDKAAAEEHFRARQESGVDQKRTLAELQYLKIYPKEPRKWVEDLKTPPGWFSEETGHWEGLEHGDDFEYAEYWRSALPMIAAEREAAVKKETPKGMKVIAPSDTAGYYRFGITQQEIDSIPNISQKVLDAISFNEATQREINQFRKERAIDTWGYKPHDTGSTPVQIAVLSEKINYLSDHLTRHPKDKHSAYGFQRIRNRRKALMKYLKKKDTPTYFKLLRQLNIRDV